MTVLLTLKYCELRSTVPKIVKILAHRPKTQQKAEKIVEADFFHTESKPFCGSVLPDFHICTKPQIARSVTNWAAGNPVG